MLAEKENKEIKRAINTLDFLSKDPKERERHNSIVMAEYNRLVSEQNFFEDGRKEGKMERKNRTELSSGAKEKTIEIAKKMFKEKLPIEMIEKLTGLSKEEIEKLK